MPKLYGFDRASIPGPPPSWLLGHLPALFRFLDDPIALLERLRPFGDVVAIVRDNPALVCVFGEERNREVLTNPRSFPHMDDLILGRPGTPMARIQGSIVNINGDLHKRRRRLIMPAFTKSALDGYAEQIVEIVEEHVAGWPIGEVVDLDDLLREMTLAFSMRTQLGLDASRNATEFRDALDAFIDAFSSPLAQLLPYDVPGLPHARAQKIAVRVLEGFDRLIAEKRRHGQSDVDALARMINAVDDDGARYTDDELVPDTVTVFFAGHDTMARTLSWTMFLLDRYPRVLEDLLDEIDGVLGGRSMHVDDIPRMPLLDRVIKESQRILCAVPVLFLRVPEDEVTVGGVSLPRHANVVVSPLATHHDPESYPEPRRFDPERWARLKPSTYAYLPFGAGPRTCIGGAFAHQALRLVVPTVLQRTRPAVVAGAKVSTTVRANIMRPTHGLRARLHSARTRGLTPASIRGDIHRLVES